VQRSVALDISKVWPRCPRHGTLLNIVVRPRTRWQCQVRGCKFSQAIEWSEHWQRVEVQRARERSKYENAN